jgi:hypothetical protein
VKFPKKRTCVLPANTRPARKGYVYLFQYEQPSPVKSTSIYKIGRSANPRRRIEDFGGLPFKLELVGMVASYDTIGLEEKLHRFFQSRRLNGEWFVLSKREVTKWFEIAESHRGGRMEYHEKRNNLDKSESQDMTPRLVRYVYE